MDPIHLHRIAVEAMRSRGLRPAFAPQALQEAEAARRTDPERYGTTFVRISRPLLEGRVVRGFEGLDVGNRLRGRLLMPVSQPLMACLRSAAPGV